MAGKINRIDRLARREEKDILKRIFFLSVICVVIIFVLFTTGTTFLGKIADFTGSISNKRTTGNENKFVQIPTIDSVPVATNSADLKFTGFSADGIKIEVFRDNEKIADTNVDNSRFQTDNIKLDIGENNFRFRAIGENESSSDFSQTIKVIFDKREPKLDVATPQEGQNFSGENRIKIEGITEKDVQVFANGFLANVSNDGKFDVTIPLVDGDNNLEVKAINDAGNSKVVKIKVTFHK